MTWIGKILAVLVMVTAVAWGWFTVAVFAARTNWKARADEYQKAHAEARAAIESEHRLHLAERDALTRDLAVERSKSDGLAKQVGDLQGDNAKNAAKLAQLTDALQAIERNVAELQTNLRTSLTAETAVRSRNTQLETTLVEQTRASETAQKDRQAAENLAKQAQSEKVAAEVRAERLAGQVAELRSNPGGGLPNGGLLGNKPPPPVPEGFRATVKAVEGEYVVVSLGLDSGLAVGSTVDVYRGGAGARYLGTVQISQVYPKQAVGVFRPADPKRTFNQLRPEEKPQVNDVVGRVGTSAAAR